MVQITRIYTTEDGESHFDELIEDGVEFRNYVSHSRAIGAYGLAFRETGVQREDEPDLGDWHVAPRRRVRHRARLVYRGRAEAATASALASCGRGGRAGRRQRPGDVELPPGRT